MASNLGFQTKYIQKTWCILFHPAKVPLNVVPILFKVYSAHYYYRLTLNENWNMYVFSVFGKNKILLALFMQEICMFFCRLSSNNSRVLAPRVRLPALRTFQALLAVMANIVILNRLMRPKLYWQTPGSGTFIYNFAFKDAVPFIIIQFFGHLWNKIASIQIEK